MKSKQLAGIFLITGAAEAFFYSPAKTKGEGVTTSSFSNVEQP